MNFLRKGLRCGWKEFQNNILPNGGEKWPKSSSHTCWGEFGLFGRFLGSKQSPNPFGVWKPLGWWCAMGSQSEKNHQLKQIHTNPRFLGGWIPTGKRSHSSGRSPFSIGSIHLHSECIFQPAMFFKAILSFLGLLVTFQDVYVQVREWTHLSNELSSEKQNLGTSHEILVGSLTRILDHDLWTKTIPKIVPLFHCCSSPNYHNSNNHNQGSFSHCTCKAPITPFPIHDMKRRNAASLVFLATPRDVFRLNVRDGDTMWHPRRGVYRWSPASGGEGGSLKWSFFVALPNKNRRLTRH